MKVYLVYHYIVLECEEFMPSGVVDYVAESLTDAICYMEKCGSDELSWWKVEAFETNKDYTENDDQSGEDIGWYSNEVIKLKYSPYQEIVKKMIDDYDM